MARPAPDCRDPVDFHIDHEAQFDAGRSRALRERAGWMRFWPMCRRAARSSMPVAGAASRSRPIRWRGFAVTGVDALLHRARQRHPQARWVHADLLASGSMAFSHGTVSSTFRRRRSAPSSRCSVRMLPRLFTSGGAHGEATNPMFGERLCHGSLSPQEYRALLAAQGFHVVRHVAQDPTCGERTVWLARREYEEEFDD